MCGRYTLIDLAKFTNIFPWLTPPEDVRPRYNIAPSQEIAVVANHEPRKLEFFSWGLVPFWAQDPKIGNRMINARGETLAQKPAFREAFRKRRCLILADGFYEWRDPGGKVPKIPHYIRMRGGEPFLIAGLWEMWRPEGAGEDEKLLSCTIVTGPPNDLLRPIHDRMPVIVPRDKTDQWLDPNPKKPEELADLLKAYPADQMEAYPVSRAVNDPRKDEAACVEKVAG